MSITAKEQCIKNYGRTWTKSMIMAACAKGKITESEYEEITGEKYTGETYIPSNEVTALKNQLASQDEAIIALYEKVGGAE